MPAPSYRIRAVLFDVGGTLLRVPDFLAWTEQARRDHLELRPEELEQAYVETLDEFGAEPRRTVGEAGTVHFWHRTLSRACRKELPVSSAVGFVAALGERAAPVRSYDDARGCLDQLREDGRALGVISNATGEILVREVLGHAGLLEYFGTVVASGSEGVEKPHPEIFLRAVRRMGVMPAEALYVGDLADTDARAAQAAGLHGLWLNREASGPGTDPPEIASLREVLRCVRRLDQGLPMVTAGR